MNNFTKIITNRLTIRPLNEEELRKYILNDYSLEVALSLEPRPRIVSDIIRTIVEMKMLPNLGGNEEDNLFYTFWIVVDMALNTVVADFCFKNVPNEKGEVEIGYGTYPGSQNKGYMTEAIGGLVSWSFQQDTMKAILAETELSNIASIRILEKNNFEIVSQTAENIYWRLAVV